MQNAYEQKLPEWPEWMKTRVAKEYSSLSEKKLKKLREKGGIAFKKVGREYYYSKSSLDAYDESPKRVESPKPKVILQQIPQKEVKTSKKEDAKMANWKGPDKARRYRLSLADGQILEWPKNGGHSYQMFYRENGKRTAIRLKATSRAEAIEEYAKLRAQLYEKSEAENTEKDWTWSEAISEYLDGIRHLPSYKGIERIARKLIEPHFGNLLLKDTRFRDGEHYRDRRRNTITVKGDRVQDITIKTELAIAQAIYATAIRKDRVDKANPLVGDYKLIIKNRSIWMQEGEEALLWPVLERYPEPMKDLAEFILNTGMRPKNILLLTWEQIRWDEELIFVPAIQMKNRREDGWFGINETARAILEKYRKHNGSFPYVFARQDAVGNFRRITPSWYQRLWREACEEAGIKTDLRFYELKHTLGTRMAINGESQFIIQGVMNHASLASTARYVKNSKKAATEALKRFENGVNGGVKSSPKEPVSKELTT